LGGTFDPKHYGFVAAEEALPLQLDEVVFIQPTPPQTYFHVSSAEHRFSMTCLKSRESEIFRISGN
jgi:nicotinic acid mononucleotide adenylyltransferase